MENTYIEARSYRSQVGKYFTCSTCSLKTLSGVKIESVVCFNGIETICSLEVMHGLTCLLSKCQGHYLVALHLHCKGVSTQP